MHSRISDSTVGPALPGSAGHAPLRESASNGLKIVIVGGFGVGKTTMVKSVSEIRPLSTEETMTQAGVGIDDASLVRDKTTTTVAFDFGRISLDEQMVLYLFGAPGQERFWFLWDRLFAGTLGAVVLVDTNRLADSWYALDRLEHHGTPFIVARNNFTEPRHSLEDVREALDLSPDVPMIDCDARKRDSSKAVLVALARHLYSLSTDAAGKSTAAAGKSTG
ncbi:MULTISPECIES: GTP-binding protein [Streptomyces]|uniref:Signal recognition particle receptor subunit beta n=2 Tax=Streptomyces TaxID=1883 RepID=A0ABT9KKC3_9ACTN|nr:signal recognition particle receptor subunit beta [Streptomyces demainii]GHJ30097.1 ATP-binding protein [Streptomyces hygroscopicus]